MLKKVFRLNVFCTTKSITFQMFTSSDFFIISLIDFLIHIRSPKIKKNFERLQKVWKFQKGMGISNRWKNNFRMRVENKGNKSKVHYICQSRPNRSLNLAVLFWSIDLERSIGWKSITFLLQEWVINV